MRVRPAPPARACASRAGLRPPRSLMGLGVLPVIERFVTGPLTGALVGALARGCPSGPACPAPPACVCRAANTTLICGQVHCPAGAREDHSFFAAVLAALSFLLGSLLRDLPWCCGRRREVAVLDHSVAALADAAATFSSDDDEDRDAIQRRLRQRQ